MESEQSTLMDLVKDVVQSSMKSLEFDKKRMKKAGRYIDQDVVNIALKMRKIAWKPWRIKRYNL